MATGADGPPPHYHAGSAEIFFVLDGALEALAGDRVLTLGKGDFLAVPAFMPHAFAAPAGSSAAAARPRAGARRRPLASAGPKTPGRPDL